MTFFKRKLFSSQFFYVAFSLIALFFMLNSYVNYVELIERNNLELDKSMNLIGESIISRLVTVDKLYYMLEKDIDEDMYSILMKISNDYNNKNALKKDYKSYIKNFPFMDLYIINKNNVIVDSTDYKEIGLNFNKYKNFSKKLNKIRENRKYYSDRITLSTLTHELKKYSYLPSDDNRYIFEAGYKMEKFEDFLGYDGFQKLGFLAQTIDPNLEEVNFLNSFGRSYNTKIDISNIKDKTRYKYEKLALIKNKKTTFITKKNNLKTIYTYYPYKLENKNSNIINMALEIVYSNKNILEKHKDKLFQQFGVSIIFLFFLIIMHQFYRYNFLKPLNKVLNGIEKVKNNDFDVFIDLRVDNEIKIMADHFNEMISNINVLINEKQNANTELEKTLEKNEKAYLETVRALANSIEAKDEYTGGHCERVTKMSMLLAEYLNLSNKMKNELKFGSLLHDIGKIGIKDKILNKSGNFTDEEYEEIKRHPKIGYEIIKDIEFLDKVKNIVLYHHERIDGEGYPNKLKGKQIPYLAKILSITDAFDAMTSKRIYKTKVMTVKEAFEELNRCKGTHFDADLVKNFIKAYTKKFGHNLSQNAENIEKKDNSDT